MVALDPALLEGHRYYKIPAGYEPATGFATFDHEKQELGCVISNADRYKGGCIGKNVELNLNEFQQLLEEMGAYSPNGKPAVGMDWPTASGFARKKGLGWEAGYYYSDAIFKILFPITHGTRNAQAPFRNEKDANGLIRAGLEKVPNLQRRW
ncbi:MAG: hypothetical protein LUF04_16135 [Bacteroides sp.]|nr:hypothetical protein [Bacteroides sp.]